VSVVANTEPKQVYDGNQGFVSERTIKDIIIMCVCVYMIEGSLEDLDMGV